MQQYLASSKYIDWQDPAIMHLASVLAKTAINKLELAKACFAYVRDEITHSGDVEASTVSCKASEVLQQKTGWCYAKSHLLAALLRANQIPAALIYQRLKVDDSDDEFTFHGLVSVYLDDHGWYRCDPRGNKPGVNSWFNPPIESLAWTASEKGEINFSQRFAEPLPAIIEILSTSTSSQQVRQNLPDGTHL